MSVCLGRGEAEAEGEIGRGGEGERGGEKGGEKERGGERKGQEGERERVRQGNIEKEGEIERWRKGETEKGRWKEGGRSPINRRVPDLTGISRTLLL